MAIKTKFIAFCTFTVDGDTDTSRVKYNGKSTFKTYDEALKAVEADMAEYAEAERDAGFETEVVGLHLEWKDEYVDREAKWEIYEV